jgi:tetratricopeptide (TPR) repeat protein
VHSLIKTLTGIAAAAALGAVLMVGTTRHASAQAPAAQQAAQPGQPAAQPVEKKPKDQGEFDIANAVFTNTLSTTPNWPKAITDLNTWIQKYPESDWKNERLLYYLQAYAGTKDLHKALEYAAQLLAMDLKTAIKDQSDVLKVLYQTALIAASIPDATPPELATGQKAASALLEFTPTYFTPANKPPGASDADWANTRTQLDALGKATIETVAMFPGNQDVAVGAAAAKEAVAAKSDPQAAQAADARAKAAYGKAEQDFTKALQQYPDNGLIAYSLGSAIMSEKDPSKYSLALYEVARGAAMDPAKGGIADTAMRTQVDGYLKRVYTTVHGSDEGLDPLKQQALLAPLPPAGFAIKTVAEVAAEKQKAFQEKYPELALWMGIKGLLAGPDGDKNFAEMKDSKVAGLKGKVMSGVPECRSKEILVAVPEPDQKSTLTAEIALKLDKPLTGKPVAGTEIKWDGQPTALTKEPFMLTMSVDQADLQGMSTDPCTPPVVKKAPPKGVTKKK